MAITAALVKELRERTGAGMMECKKALVETDGDIELALDNLRKAGAAKADKKSGRVAAEGRVVYQLSEDGRTVAIVEVNCETDFVAGDDNFTEFATNVCKRVLADDPADVEALGALPIDDSGDMTVNAAREALVGKIGENIQIRRFYRLSTEHRFGLYQHGARIGVVVDYEGGSDELGKDIAMHIAASRPVCVTEDQVPAEMVEREREIFLAQAKESGKPEEIAKKMVEGKMRKFMSEITLLGQPFVKDPDQTVGKLLAGQKAKVHSFLRIEVGEGIEKKSENFAEEVMSQIK